MFCIKCGNSNPEGARFCTTCGAQMVSAAPQSVQVPHQNQYNNTSSAANTAAPTLSVQQNSAPLYFQDKSDYSAQSAQPSSVPSYFQTQQNTNSQSGQSYFKDAQTQNTQQTYQQQTKPANIPGNGFAIAALVLGISSIALFYKLFIAFVCAILGIVFGCIASGKARQCEMKNSIAKAGIICSSVGLGLSLVFLIFVIVGVVSFVASTISHIPVEIFSNGVLEII